MNDGSGKRLVLAGWVAAILAGILVPRLSDAADMSGEAYFRAASAAALDDKCKLLPAEPRRTLDAYRSLIQARLAVSDPDFPNLAKPAIEQKAAAKAAETDCQTARYIVRDVYETAVAEKLAAATAPLTLGMNVGRRCHVLTEVEGEALLAAWKKRIDYVSRHYSAGTRMKFMQAEHRYDVESGTLPCSAAAKTAEAAKAALNDPSFGD